MTSTGSAISSPSAGAGSRWGALALALLSCATTAGPGCGGTSSTPRPDILLVVWDTCRADRVSAQGYALPTTPRLAALAREGVIFRRCITPSPWTPPAHGSLFTGLLPLHHGLRESPGDRVHPDLPLLAATLRSAGYETVAVPANPLLSATGLLEGFETVFPVGKGDVKGRSPEVVARVEEWIRGLGARSTARKPFFLFVNLMDAHLPLDPEPEDLVAVHGAAGAAKVPAGGPAVDEVGALAHLTGIRRVSDDDLRVLSLAYDGAVHRADRATGKILDLLKGASLLDETVVAVVGDHGESLGEHGDLDHRVSVHDPVLRVPLVLRWRGRFEGGRAEDAQVRVQDLYPTLLEAAGVKVPPGCGRDALSLRETPLRPRDAVTQILWAPSCIPLLRERFPAAPGGAFDRFYLSRTAIREGSTGPGARKLVVTRRLLPDGTSRLEREDLFDTASDPGEDRSLLGPGAKPEDREAATAIRARFAGILE